jgi:hypothetical protein
MEEKDLSDFFRNIAKDESAFSSGDEKEKLIYTAGFVRGASWMIKKIEDKNIKRVEDGNIE